MSIIGAGRVRSWEENAGIRRERGRTLQHPARIPMSTRASWHGRFLVLCPGQTEAAHCRAGSACRNCRTFSLIVSLQHRVFYNVHQCRDPPSRAVTRASVVASRWCRLLLCSAPCPESHRVVLHWYISPTLFGASRIQSVPNHLRIVDRSCGALPR